MAYATSRDHNILEGAHDDYLSARRPGQAARDSPSYAFPFVVAQMDCHGGEPPRIAFGHLTTDACGPEDDGAFADDVMIAVPSDQGCTITLTEQDSTHRSKLRILVRPLNESDQVLVSTRQRPSAKRRLRRGFS